MFISRFPGKNEFKQLRNTCNVIPVCMEILADTETPVSLLKKVQCNGKPLFLFESVEGGERWGRFSFLGASAKTQIQVFNTHVRIEENRGIREIEHHGKPFSVLRTHMSGYRPAQLTGLPRFWGGLVGYLTYEMVSFFEAIPNHWPADKPLAHFIIPDRLLVFDNIRHTLLLVVITFSEPGDNPEAIYDQAMASIHELYRLTDQPVPDSGAMPTGDEISLKQPWDSEIYRTLVRRVKEYIVAGDIIQAVISQPFVCRMAPDLWTLYRAQRFVNPSPYLFFLHFDQIALIGSSPETMVRLENGVATLRPIAGTRPRGASEQQDRALADELLADEKERAEHLMLVDLGRNDLGRVAEIGSVQVTDLMFVERYSHVMHLVSNITCDLKQGYDAWDVLEATFPAGTLSGAPKIRAMEIIHELENIPRGPYGGAVGYVSFSGNMDMAITIRTACVENGSLIVRAGAGIVADSNPEKERIETVNKAMAIQRALELVKKGVISQENAHDSDDR
jgi:anthranilate synthase component 1